MSLILMHGLYLFIMFEKYGSTLYYYSRKGVALGAQNLELDESAVQKLHKLTVVE